MEVRALKQAGCPSAGRVLIPTTPLNRQGAHMIGGADSTRHPQTGWVPHDREGAELPPTPSTGKVLYGWECADLEQCAEQAECPRSERADCTNEIGTLPNHGAPCLLRAMVVSDCGSHLRFATQVST